MTGREALEQIREALATWVEPIADTQVSEVHLDWSPATGVLIAVKAEKVPEDDDV